MNDDELDRLLSTANPARTPLDATPDFALLHRITSESPKRQPFFSGRQVRLFLAPAAAVLVAILALVVINPFSPSPAAAYGPTALWWSPTEQSISEVAALARERLSRSPGPTTASRESVATSWSLSVNESGEAEQVTSISPLVTDLSWNEDLSGRRVVTAGTPYSIAGGSVSSDTPSEGTVLDDMTFGTGQFPALAPDAGTLDAAGFQDLLAAYAPKDSGATAGDAMLGIADVLGEWTLSNEQHSYLLEALLGYDGLTVLGTTTDRLGREVVGLSSNAVMRPGETTTLLISAATGRIVGLETTVTSDDASAPVPVGTVIQYTLWKDTE